MNVTKAMAAAVAAMVLATPALADWRMLTGPEIAKALRGTKLSYGQAWQTFSADGRTVFNDGSDSRGIWRISGDFYCSQWPPANGWACYQVKLDASDGALKFIAEDDTSSIGIPVK